MTWMSRIFLVFFLVYQVPARATAIRCSYLIYGAPFSDIKIDFYPDGSVSPLAEISVQGKMHTETATAAPRSPGEMVHYWISQESEENQIEAIIYEQPTAQGQSKVINYKMPPFGREIWGSCTY